MTYDLDIWHACSSQPYVGQVQRSRLQVSSWSVYYTSIPFSVMDACYEDTFFVVCQILCAKVVGATSSEGFLV